MSNPYDAYRKVQTETSDPGELLLLLYRGAVRSVRDAESSFERGDLQSGNRQIIRTQSILLELLGTLDYSHGEIPEKLSSLYTYLYQALLQANVKKDVGLLQQVGKILTRLTDAWERAVASLTRGPTVTSGVDVRIRMGGVSQ